MVWPAARSRERAARLPPVSSSCGRDFVRTNTDWDYRLDVRLWCAPDGPAAADFSGGPLRARDADAPSGGCGFGVEEGGEWAALERVVSSTAAVRGQCGRSGDGRGVTENGKIQPRRWRWRCCCWLLSTTACCSALLPAKWGLFRHHRRAPRWSLTVSGGSRAVLCICYYLYYIVIHSETSTLPNLMDNKRNS